MDKREFGNEVPTKGVQVLRTKPPTHQRFREEAIRLARSSGKPLSQIARELEHRPRPCASELDRPRSATVSARGLPPKSAGRAWETATRDEGVQAGKGDPENAACSAREDGEEHACRERLSVPPHAVGEQWRERASTPIILIGRVRTNYLVFAYRGDEHTLLLSPTSG